MVERNYSRFSGTGRYVPSRYSENGEVEDACGLEPGWIEKRTGILRRPTADPDQAVSDLAISAGKNAMENWSRRDSVEVESLRPQIGMLILATSTPDYLLPPTAPYVAARLNLGKIPAFDIAVACSGFLYALKLANDFCRTNAQSVLVIAANLLTRRVSPKDVATAAIFSDGAGAAIVSPASQPGMISIALESDGTGYDHLMIPDGGSRNPVQSETFQKGDHLMQISNGMAVYRYAVEAMAGLGQRVLTDAGITVEELDFWIPHQANRRIIESVQSRLGIANSKVGCTIEDFANSSAATIPIALDYFLEREEIASGDLILLTAAAAGLSSGAAIVRL